MSEINLADLIDNELKIYSKDVQTKLNDIVKSKAKKLKEKIQESSPVKTGKYKKGWTVKEDINGLGDVTATVYNKAKPQITHLIQNGHVTRDGGRVAGRDHISSNRDQIEEELIEDIKKAIGE